MPEAMNSSTLQPIVPPPTPAQVHSGMDLGIALGLGVTLGLILLVIWFVRCGRRWRARRGLKKTQIMLRNRRIAPTVGAFDVAAWLRWYFRLNHLQASIPPNGVDREGWMRCVTRLDVLRYRSHAAVEAENLSLLIDTIDTLEAWLRCSTHK